MVKKNKQTKAGLYVVATIAAIIVILFLVVSYQNYRKRADARMQDSVASGSGVSVSERYQTVTAEQIARVYKDNEAAGDATFKDKRFRVTGRVDSIEKNVVDEIVVQLNGGGLWVTVSATLAAGQESGATSLRKGQSVALICTGEGEVLGHPFLNDCVF